MRDLIISYSGLRGIVGTALTEDVAARYGHAFGQLVREQHPTPLLLLARDTRASGPALCRGIVRGLARCATVIDLGVVPTPTLQLCVSLFGAAGGVCVTASHNTKEWNGLKFFLSSPASPLAPSPAIVLGGAEMKRLIGLASAATPASSAPEPPSRHEEAIAAHVSRVVAAVNAGAIRERRFKVAIDSARGAGKEATERLLDALGCQAVIVATDRESEPTPERLGDLRDAVLGARCDVGFAQDLDADRLALVTGAGDIPGEDTTLVLAIDHLLRRFPSGDRVVVKNVATTRAVDEVVRAHGATLIETPVGEVNLSRALISAVQSGKTAFGGEGNGGVIYPPIVYGRDSLIGIALILEAMLEPPRPLPHFHMLKEKIPAPADLEALFAKVQACYPDATADRKDGLRLGFQDGAWLIVRASNTEPIVRVIAESSEPAWPRQVMAQIRKI
jgi:phosphomannomutase